MADADTAAKRLSMLDWCSSPYGVALPFPDGAVAVGDRQHLLWSYSGISWGAAVVVVVTGATHINLRGGHGRLGIGRARSGLRI